MHADLRVFDSVWTTANISGYRGAMICDMLFNVDEEFARQPQMIGKWRLSEDKKALHL
jgi:peptide/nickel transport system substrate-binding protein